MTQATKAPTKAAAKKIPATKRVSAAAPTKIAVKAIAKKVVAKTKVLKAPEQALPAKKASAAVENAPVAKIVAVKAAPVKKAAVKKTAAKKSITKKASAKLVSAKSVSSKKPTLKPTLKPALKTTLTALESALKVAAKRPASGLPKRSSKPIDPLKAVIMKAVEDLKAKDVIVLDVRSRTTVTDELIIATGTSTRHVKSIADSVVKAVKAFGIPPIGVEGEGSAEWVLVDLGDYVVHVFQAEMREFYALEKLWGSNTPIDNSL